VIRKTALLFSRLAATVDLSYQPIMIDWKQLPTLITDRICLRPVSPADIDALFKIFSDPEVIRYWAAPALKSRDAATDLVNEIHDRFKRHEMLKWGLALRETNLLIGTTTLFNLNLQNERAEIGYGLARDYWGHGYMCEALRALLQYAFEVLNLHRLEADVDPRNSASIRTLERLGFKREGYLRERWHINNEIQDTVFFGLLRSEWKQF